MRDVAIVGAAMTRFGKYPDKGLKELSREAVDGALSAGGLEKKDLQIAIVGNAAAGLITGQECIRAQVILREMGIDKIPMVNTENACASSSTAIQLAWLYVASGMRDVALALGVEKMYSEDKAAPWPPSAPASTSSSCARLWNNSSRRPSRRRRRERRWQIPKPVHGHLRRRAAATWPAMARRRSSSPASR
jgi:acetyl-CoA acetyltransferase